MSTWKDALADAQGGDTQGLIEEVQRLETRRPGRGWLRLWRESQRDEHPVLARTLAFFTVGDNANAPVAEAVQSWLITEWNGDDFTTQLNIISGVRSYVNRQDVVPPATSSWLLPFLCRCLTGETVVRHAVFDLVDQLLAVEQGAAFLNDAAAKQLALALQDAVGETVVEEEVERLAEIVESLTVDDFGYMPVRADDCRRIAGGLNGSVARSTGTDRTAAVALLACFRRVVSAEEAAEQAVARQRPVYTLRAPNVGSMGLVDRVLALTRALLHQSFPAESEPPDVPAILLAPSMASFGLHWTFTGAADTIPFGDLDSLFSAAWSPNGLAGLADDFDVRTLLAHHALLDVVRRGEKGLEVTITEPNKGVQWRRSTTLRLPTPAAQSIKAFGLIAAGRRRGTPVVRQDEVPQANSIEKVVHVVDAMLESNEVNPEDIDVGSKRQVDYYKHACRVLGLLDSFNRLTDRGIAMEHMDSEQRMAALARYFVDSPVCRSWARWGEVGDVFQLDADSAETFMAEADSGLSGATPKRRASTLEAWHVELKPYF